MEKSIEISSLIQENSKEGRILKYTIALSLLLHTAAFLLVEYTDLNLMPAPHIVPTTQKEQEPMVFHIVESNPEAETPELQESQFASDRNARAQDMNPQNDPNADAPMTLAEELITDAVPPQVEAAAAEESKSLDKFEKFDPSKLGIMPPEEKESNEKQQDESQPNDKTQMAVLPDNIRGSAPDLGGFALSTYAWDFAPYMLEVKRRIGENIHPSTAFNMGLISGTYVIRFTINRNGTITHIQVLDSRGNKSLETTSLNAIKYSTPLRPLPADFPDQNLVVTGTFRFKITR